MKKMKCIVFLASVTLLLTGCGQSNVSTEAGVDSTTVAVTDEEVIEGVKIKLSDEDILVNGEAVSTDADAAVYMAKDIVYYEEGKDFTYGEGTEADEHSAEEAAAHTVVHITKPGTYELSGTLSAGQIAVDLGEDAEDNPEAVVALILNNVDISCSVAPAVIFYNVYECSAADEETATKDVDTSAAGANVIIADGSENNISGSYVARIYESVELNEDGTEVVDSKKLHKYDAAFYSKMSMNVNGGKEGTGVLNITAENEGLDSELHLTLNGGNINIVSGNDGINTNEDYVSVTTVNGGTLDIQVTGATGEGDGIDSNGWLVINGGTVIAEACGFSGDAGIDSDMGIHINGGTVIATGNMLDRISDSAQNYVVMNFAETQKAGETYTLKNEKGQTIIECTPENDFMYLIVADDALVEGTYSMWMGDVQLEGAAGGTRDFGGEMPEGMGMPENGEMPEGMEMPEGGFGGRMSGGQMPEGMTPPESMEIPENGEKPEGGQMPEGMTPPEGMELPENGEMPQGGFGGRMPGGMGQVTGEESIEFNIAAGGNYFMGVTAAE